MTNLFSEQKGCSFSLARELAQRISRRRPILIHRRDKKGKV